MRPLIFLALFPAFLPAQTAFLKDPDVVWAVEIEQDWVVDLPSLISEQDSGITTLKLLRVQQEEYYSPGLFLVNLVFQAAWQGKLLIFKDMDGRIPADMQMDVLRPLLDTVAVFNPETYEETTVVVQNFQPFRDVRAWRLRQILAYHQKSATWSTTGVAIAPLIRASSQPADTADLRPLFWFRPDNKPQKLTSNAIVWAKETVNKPVGTRVSAVPQQFLKIVYGFQNPLPHLLQTFKTKPKEPFYDAWNEKPLSSTDRASLLAKTDTVWIYDDYEERPRIVHSEITAANISQLQLIQTWYWDDRRHRLSICLDAVAPLVDIHRYADDLRFQKPLFYRRARR